ncbi:MAG TPA: DNA polymerase III subunit delta' [Nitrospiraceae bacterium]|nr:DNA polymerase III subunit delta' [Nitrospiraceae bacterium]
MPFADVIGHESPKALLKASIRHDRVAHAYLFHGEDHIGKRLTAMRFAQALNCEMDLGGNGPDACGVCRSCRQIDAQTHPDFMLIEPDREQANPQIKIEQIREIEQQIIYRPLIGRFKIFLFDEADRMTLGAANALLKTLEEPPAHSVFALISANPPALPATIRSRCQCVRFTAPAHTQVEAALILRRDMPPADARLLTMMTQARIGEALTGDIKAIRATQTEFRTLLSPSSLQSVTTLMATADTLHKAGRISEALEWTMLWLRDVLLLRVGADAALMLNHEHQAELRTIAQDVRIDTVVDLMAEIHAIDRASNRNINLQIALENILLRLRDLVIAPDSTTISPR